MKKVLIALKDGYVTDIKDNFDVITGGCPTCGLDEEYISEIQFDIYHNDTNTIEYFEIKSTGYYNFDFSIGDIIKLILNNLDKFSETSIAEFKVFMEEKLLD